MFVVGLGGDLQTDGLGKWLSERKVLAAKLNNLSLIPRKEPIPTGCSLSTHVHCGIHTDIHNE